MLYPLLLDETCWFLAIDFDKSTWRDDVSVFLETCQECGVPAALERSRSGNGGHVWVFFAEPIPARIVRRMGSALITLTLEKRNQIGLDSYDRMFPNQDTLPREKKLGNLIALPLQRMAGKEGNSLFIDHKFEPYSDQWIYLSSIRKMSLPEVEAVVREVERQGNVISVMNPLLDDDMENDVPWKLSANSQVGWRGEAPSVVRAVLSDKLYIEKQGLSAAQLNVFIRMGAFQNPEFYRAQKMRLKVWGIPRIIDCTEDHELYLSLPRGCLEQVTVLLKEHGTAFELKDERNAGKRIEVEFHGSLRGKQQKAVAELQKVDMGTLSATTAFGKTVVGIWMIAARKTNTLILVNRT